MIDRRGVIPVLILLALVVIGTGASIVTGTAPPRTPAAAQPTPASSAQTPAIAAAVARVQHAFNTATRGRHAGPVRSLTPR